MAPTYACLIALLPLAASLTVSPRHALLHEAAVPRRHPTPVAAEGSPTPASPEEVKSPEEVTNKFGLEAGLFSVFRSKEQPGGESKLATAGQLLKRYGGAYLLTSTSLALVSFTLCYLAIDNGVNVADLLQRVGIEVSSTSETAGTVGLAYAVHKAASPIRFPRTVALTPVVARSVFGRDVEAEEAGSADEA